MISAICAFPPSVSCRKSPSALVYRCQLLNSSSSRECITKKDSSCPLGVLLHASHQLWSMELQCICQPVCNDTNIAAAATGHSIFAICLLCARPDGRGRQTVCDRTVSTEKPPVYHQNIMGVLRDRAPAGLM